MAKVLKFFTALILALMLVGLTVVITFAGFQQYYFGGNSAAAKQVSSKTMELYAYLDHYFIGEVDPDAVADAASAAMVMAIDDEWSYYISAEDYAAHIEQLENAYVGVGITIQLHEESGLYEVTEVNDGGPAEQAGVQVGDRITAVDGTDVRDLPLEDIRNMVRGEAGTEVTVDFLRDGETVICTMVRASIKTIVVHAQMLPSGDGYIIIDNFDGGCAAETQAAVEDLMAQGAKSIIFDVRFNPGGLKSELIELLDYLLPEGEIFHTVNYAGQEEISQSDADCVDIPMAVLVNIDSYSAAEFFAAALQEYDAATVVGVQTYGKGRFQSALQLSDGSAVNLSIGEYYTPAGKSLAGVGITPDIIVELDEADLEALYYGKLEIADDEQLQAAIQAMAE